MPRIYGKRIMLREYWKEDLEHMRGWVNDPVVVDNLSDVFLYPHTVNETEKFLHAVLEGKMDLKGFVIAGRETEEYIGQIDMFNLDWKNRSAILGIVIGAAENRNRGFGSEAIGLLLEFAFNELNLNRLQLDVFDYNEAAIRCYRKCGFIEEGRKREAFYHQGRYHDSILMSVLKREYQQNGGQDG